MWRRFQQVSVTLPLHSFGAAAGAFSFLPGRRCPSCFAGAAAALRRFNFEDRVNQWFYFIALAVTFGSPIVYLQTGWDASSRLKHRAFGDR